VFSSPTSAVESFKYKISINSNSIDRKKTLIASSCQVFVNEKCVFREQKQNRDKNPTMADDQANKSNLVKGPDEPAVEDPNDRKSRLERFTQNSTYIFEAQKCGYCKRVCLFK